ncbi:MAG: methylmalonyl Co-A mutase-associated GTPase MeaB [Fimbriimonadaceae bacterium]|nr:methylmalonyl Co-A mutase-associated GTPase MeaB [Fimbriimonadaceae bacterium]
MRSSRGPSLTPQLWERFLGGERRACAQVITKVENDPDAVPEIRDRLSGRLGRAIRIGITGPPGVGKSTLTSALARGLADGGNRVGIVAVDPSSPFTGGAFMGDRIRMDALVGDDRVFMRSLASRAGQGGLAPSTAGVADVLEAFGMDRILIETVGVGQAELDVMACADIVVLVLQPSTGDAIQSLKSGIIEAADVVVVNKADLPGVEMLLQSLRFAFSLGAGRPGTNATPILATSAQASEGIGELVAELESQASDLVDSGRHREMRRARLENEIRRAIQTHLWASLERAVGASAKIRRHAEELTLSGGSPYPFIRRACAATQVCQTKEEAWQ